MRNKLIGIAIISILATVFLLYGIDNREETTVASNELSQCLAEKGAEFFGAFWCPHCARQKSYFGRFSKQLPYIECSNSDKSQTQVCIDENIRSYPTWKFSSGAVCPGVVDPIILAYLSSCGPTIDKTAFEVFDEIEISRLTESHASPAEQKEAAELLISFYEDTLQESFGVGLEGASGEQFLSVYVGRKCFVSEQAYQQFLQDS